MGVKTPKQITEIARKMRKNMTPAENKIWKYLRYDQLGYRFLRQKPLYVFTEDSGQDRFIIPDFYCHEKRLILEIDGSIHDTTNIQGLDEVKKELLEKQGIQVLRIQNEDIINQVETVIAELKIKLS